MIKLGVCGVKTQEGLHKQWRQLYWLGLVQRLETAKAA